MTAGYHFLFWFILSKNVLATILLQYRMNVKKNLDKYFKEFISKFSDYVVLGDSDEADFNVVGYSEKDGDEPINLHSQFKTSIVRKPGQIDYILEQKNQIRKITRHKDRKSVV